MKVLAALLAGLTVLCWCCPPPAVSRLVRLSGRPFRWRIVRRRSRDGRPPRVRAGYESLQEHDHGDSAVSPVVEHSGTPSDRRRPRLASPVLAGVAAGFVVGGGAGVVLGVVVAVVVHLTLRRIPSRAERLRLERLQADLPLAADLLAACLRTGRPPDASIDAIAEGMGGQLGAELGRVAASLRLGCEPRAGWENFLTEPVLAPFGRAMVRVWDSGAPLAATLDRLATDARRSRRAAAEQKARAVGVRSAVPLGLCFLPAFVLVGIVPLVAGAVGGLLR